MVIYTITMNAACVADPPEFLIDPPAVVEFPQTPIAPSNLHQIG